MKRIVSILSLILLFALNAGGTHNRAGEITFRQVGDLTFEIKITTFTYTLSAADRNQLEVQWGDGTTSIAPRDSITFLPNFYKRNVYSARHTYPGPGAYIIVVQDPNRNFGVQNIPNSVNVIFSIKTTLLINPQLGYNNTPVLLNPPYDKAALGKTFIHNPSAFDEDGDSLSYKLTVCTEANGKPIEDYSYPDASDSLFVDPRTGDLVWDAPTDTGIYNIAMDIEEWRNGVKIGNIVRDMQIEVYNTDNNPPLNENLRDFCIEAGDTLRFEVSTTDEDGDRITLLANGGPLELDESPASFVQDTTYPGQAYGSFSWITTCSHVRDQPYGILIKAEDDNPEVKLVDIDNFSVKVLGPAPTGLHTLPGSNSIRLRWDQYDCENIKAYRIYRSTEPIIFTPDSCTNGIPDSLAYRQIGGTGNRSDTVYVDDDQGKGLAPGVTYCYRIVAVFDNDTESKASAEVCDILVPGTPAMIKTSVQNTGSSDGTVLIGWAKPDRLDTIPANGPYEYQIFRSNDALGDNLELIDAFSTIDLNDTTYLDEDLNTLEFPYSYKVELYNDEPGNRFLIGQAEIASTVWEDIVASDNRIELNINKYVPWINTSYVVYRQDPVSPDYDSIGFTNSRVFVDSMLVNGQEYCYRVRSIGWRTVANRYYSIENWSHPICGTPLDTVPPCPPELSVRSLCDSLYNELTWNNPNLSCADDVVGYNIYYSGTTEDPLTLLDSIDNPETTLYRHYSDVSLAACYAVTAIDSFGNESDWAYIVCVDECTNYKLPEYFSPNNDGYNDIFRPNDYSFVESVDMKIYNRWGQLIFETTDPDINWDGKIKDTDDLATPGIYYYVCDVYEYRLTGLEVRNLVGFVQLFREKDATNTIE